MVQDHICVCRVHAEMTGHLFWTCPRAREVWLWSKIAVSLGRNGVQSFMELLWDLLVGDHVDEEKVAQVVCIA